jgi:hypothetical protein
MNRKREARFLKSPAQNAACRKQDQMAPKDSVESLERSFIGRGAVAEAAGSCRAGAVVVPSGGVNYKAAAEMVE